MKTVLATAVCFAILLTTSCEKTDTIDPFIIPNTDTLVHYLGEPYIDAGAQVIDNNDCNLPQAEIILNEVNTSRYGTYNVKYYAQDMAGNSTRTTRFVDIVLKPEQYYSLNYDAADTCTTGIYTYTAYIQDCDCEDAFVTVSNISNFGLSATFTLQLQGQYNHTLNLDTSLFAISFLGTGTLSPAADTLRWNYTISDSVTSDVCVSTWVKN
jgi:hypothetical protein